MNDIHMHKSFSLIFKSPARFCLNTINNKSKTSYLSFTFILILAIACAHYVSITLAFGFTDGFSLFSYVAVMLFYVALFFAFMFLDSAIISYFIKQNNYSDLFFDSRDTLFLISVASYPYTLLPAIALTAKFFNLPSLYSCFLFLAFIWVFINKIKLLRYYKDFFAISPVALTFMPIILQFAIAILTFLFFSFGIVSLILKTIQNVDFNKFIYL